MHIGRPHLALVAALVGMFLLSGQAGIQGQVDGAPVRALSVAPATAEALRDWNWQIDGMTAAETLRGVASHEVSLLPGRSVEQLDQFHAGLRVWGGGVNRQRDGDSVISMSGVLYSDITVDSANALSAEEARGRFDALGVRVGRRAEPELVVLPTDDRYELAWVADVASADDAGRYFLDGHTGALLRRDSLIYSQLPQNAYVGHGRGVLGDDKKISTAPLSGGFAAYDTIRPPEISTFDLRGNSTRADFLQRGLIGLTTADFALGPSTNDWTDGAVVDAHVYSSYTYDYLAKRHNRAGLNGRNGPVRNMVHTVRRSEYFTSPASSKWWMNAEYSSATSIIYFGEGVDFVTGGQRVNYFSAAIDIVAHELAHGVTDYSSGLEYRFESGALNESFSDIIGTSVEFAFQPAGQGLMKADYLCGEDAFTAATASGLSGIRSLENPSLFDQPDHYSRRSVLPLSVDAGGVHINSGIPNHAFYLAIEGGVNRTSGLRVQGVGAANRVQIERVFYHAFVDLMRSNATFATARTLTLQSAVDLYGQNSAPYAAVRDAWTAVGVN